MAKCRCFFLRATTLVSAGKSHSSVVNSLVVRCLLFNSFRVRAGVYELFFTSPASSELYRMRFMRMVSLCKVVFWALSPTSFFVLGPALCSVRVHFNKMSATVTMASFFFVRSHNVCVMDTFYRTTKLLDWPAERHLS